MVESFKIIIQVLQLFIFLFFSACTGLKEIVQPQVIYLFTLTLFENLYD